MCIKKSRVLWLGLSLFIVLGLAGCGQTASTPQPLPTFTPESAVLPAPVTPTSPPTIAPPTPAGPYPPILLDYTPRTGQEVAPDTPITLYFDQPMDQASVVAALRVTPAVEGDYTWPDEATLVFRPKALATAARYRVAVVGEVRSAAGLVSHPELTFSFSTFAPLQVTRVSPQAGDSEVRIDAPVWVAFNRAVVPLDCVGKTAGANMACAPLPLTFAPPIMGTGTWVDTSLYRFDPFRGWDAGVTYNVTLAEGVHSVEGVTLAAPSSWSFSTALPVIRQVSPADGQTNVPLEAAIRVIFNTPMDQEHTGNAFRVRDTGGENVPGVITWADNGATLIFTPALKLKQGMQYTVQLTARARAATSAPLQNPQTWTFTTVPYPALLTALPRADAINVDVAEPVRLTFIGALHEATLADHVVVTPTRGNVDAHFDPASGIYQLSWDKDPQTRYCVQLKPGIADIYGNVITASREFCFVTGDWPSFIGMAAPLETVTLDAAKPATVYLLVRNVGSAAFTLSTLDEASFIRGHEVAGAAIRDWKETFKTPRNVATVVPVNLRLRGDALPTGYYQLAWNNPPWGGQTIRIGVVDRHVTLKLASTQALVWVTDLRSGEPINRTPVRLVDREGVLIAAGTTDGNGLAVIPISPRTDLWEPVAAIVGEPGKAGFGVAITQWLAEATPWAAGITLDGRAASRYALALYTDRTFYHPGQTVYFRGVVREGDTRYLLPSSTLPVLVTVRGPSGQEIYSSTVTLSEMGTFDGVFALAGEATPGDYMLEARLPHIQDDRVWRVPFNVAVHQTPMFEIAVVPERTHILNGDALRAVVTVYGAGGVPAAQQSVTWKVLAEAPAAGATRLETVVAHGQATTAADGRCLIELPATLLPLDDSAALGPQSWTIEATLTGAQDVSPGGQAQVTVHPARFYVQVTSRQRVVRAGVRTEVQVLALDWEQRPVAGQVLTASLTQRVWQRVPAGDGMASQWVYTDTKVSSAKVTTDAEGRATTFVNPPRSGTYIVATDAQDADGHPVHAEMSLWVSGSEVVQWPTEPGRVTPIGDRDVYRVGETAKILVPVAFTGTYQVLITVERNDILKVERRVFDAPNPVIELPILEAYVPNVYVSVLSVRGVSEAVPAPDVRMGYLKLNVEPTVQTLNVEVLPDKVIYAPGDKVVLTLRATDATGRPVDAELGVALVDQNALPSAGLASLYGERPLQVVSGDGVLVLANRAGQRSARPGQEAAPLITRYTRTSVPEQQETRAMPWTYAHFAATALWEAHVRVNVSGEAQLTFVLPETPTRWVAQVHAVTADARIGEGRAELPALKPLLISPVLPRFLVVGDQAEVAAVIYNNAAAAVTATARLTVEGNALLPQTATIPAGGRVRVVWTVAAPQQAAETLSLVFSVAGGGYQDVVRPATGGIDGIPLYRYVSPDLPGTRGVLDEAGTRLETLYVPPEAGDASALTVRLTPSLLSAVVDSLSSLEAYARVSSDGLVGQLLAHGLTYSVLQDLEITDTALITPLQATVDTALERLYVRQNSDGGWGRWEGESALDVTAYAVLGLSRAKRAGLPVRQAAFTQAQTYVYNKLTQDLQSEIKTAEDALALYGLSVANVRWPAGAAATLYAAREALGTRGRAYLVLALGTTDAADPRIPSLLDGLRSGAQITTTGAHWESDDGAGGPADTVITALIVEVLARFAPDDPLLPQAVRWLMLTRRNEGWGGPPATLQAISGLLAALRVSGDWDAAYTWNLALNGLALTEGVARADALDMPVKLRVGFEAQGGGFPALSREPLNILEISRTAGPGRLYYTARLELALPVASIAAESRGFTLRREYCAMTDGNDAALALCQPVTTLRQGEGVEVRLTLIAPRPGAYVILEDPYPAGLEPDTESLARPSAGWWDAPFTHREWHAEHAVFMARELAAGTYRVVYRLRAATPGTYTALPATVTRIDSLEVWGRSAGQPIVVLPLLP